MWAFILFTARSTRTKDCYIGLYALTQVTLSIHLDAAQVDEFERSIAVQLAQPPWNYTDALEKGIQVC